MTTVVTAPGPMITAQSRLGEVTAQSWRGHSSVTARSQLNHGIFSMITAQSRLGHSSITAQVTAGCDHFGHCEFTVSSHGGLFFSYGSTPLVNILFMYYNLTLSFWLPISRSITQIENRINGDDSLITISLILAFLSLTFFSYWLSSFVA